MQFLPLTLIRHPLSVNLIGPFNETALILISFCFSLISTLANATSELQFPEVTFHSASNETEVEVESLDDTHIYYIGRLTNVQVGPSPEYISTM